MESMRRVEKRGRESSGAAEDPTYPSADVSSVSWQVACDDIKVDEARDREWWHGKGGTLNCSMALDARLGWETRKVFPRAASFHLELPEADSARTGTVSKALA